MTLDKLAELAPPGFFDTIKKEKCNHQLIPSTSDATTPCYACIHCDLIFEAYANPFSSKRFAEEASRVLETDASEVTTELAATIAYVDERKNDNRDLFSFTNALLLIKCNAKVSRKVWSTDNYTGSVIFIEDGEIVVSYPDNGGVSIYRATNSDLLANDWYRVD